MREVAEKILKLEFKKHYTLHDCWSLFYEIMCEHGIKQGTLTEDKKGVICDNPEWTMCKQLFIDQLNQYCNRHNMLHTPEHLHY